VPPTVDELIQERMRFQHGDITREMIEKAPPEDLLRGSSFSDACAARVRETVQNMTPRQREILSNGVVTVQHPYERFRLQPVSEPTATARVTVLNGSLKSSTCKCGHPVRLHDETLACEKCDCRRFNRRAIDFHKKD
jgi:hypothetical protein